MPGSSREKSEAAPSRRRRIRWRLPGLVVAGPVLLLLLSWTSDGTLVGVTLQGQVQVSPDAGRTWQRHGGGGGPESLTADGDTVHIAGRILSSTDRGQTFTVGGQA